MRSSSSRQLRISPDDFCVIANTLSNAETASLLQNGQFDQEGGGIDVAARARSAAWTCPGVGSLRRCSCRRVSRACSSAASTSARRAEAARSHPSGMSQCVGTLSPFRRIAG
jgi:hypothetical protein